MKNGWTPERRKRQAELIQNWKPWANATGPRTAKGKARTARNADKGSSRQMLRELSRSLRIAMREQSEVTDEVAATLNLKAESPNSGVNPVKF